MILIIYFSNKKKSLVKFNRNNWYELWYKIYVFESIEPLCFVYRRSYNTRRLDRLVDYRTDTIEKNKNSMLTFCVTASSELLSLRELIMIFFFTWNANKIFHWTKHNVLHILVRITEYGRKVVPPLSVVYCLIQISIWQSVISYLQSNVRLPVLFQFIFDVTCRSRTW